MVKMGNGFYFMFIIIGLAYTIALYFVLRKQDKKVVRTVLIVLAFCNLGLHFLKLAFEPYRSSGFPGIIRKITFENICAGTTLIMPFIYLFKKQNSLHDYLFFIGVCGGLGALFYPTEALDRAPFIFDVIRFYICHIHLFAIPALMCALNIYRPRLTKTWTIPLYFYAHLLIIFLNEIWLIKIGWVSSSMQEFFSAEVRNSSFIFGLPQSFKGVSFLLDPFIPNIFKTDVFNIMGGAPYYTPILWLVCPGLIYLPIVYLILCSPLYLTKLAKKSFERHRELVALC